MLDISESDVIIQGLTLAGKTFRPSDWAERLSGVLSSFGRERKLSYHPYVKPLMIDSVRCVCIDSKLKNVDPEVYQFLLDFAKDNDLRIGTLSELSNQKSQSR